MPLVCTSHWYSLIQNTLHGVIRNIIFTTSLSVLHPNFLVPTWTYNRDFTVQYKGFLDFYSSSHRIITYLVKEKRKHWNDVQKIVLFTAKPM